MPRMCWTGFEDDSLFALLYEADNTKDWRQNDNILEQANPLALEVPRLWMISKRNAPKLHCHAQPPGKLPLHKHCNIPTSGVETESYVDVADVQAGRVKGLPGKAGRYSWGLTWP